MQKLLPRAVDLAMAEDVEFRRGLPLDHLRVMGVVNSDTETSGRSSFLSKVMIIMIMIRCVLSGASWSLCNNNDDDNNVYFILSFCVITEEKFALDCFLSPV